MSAAVRLISSSALSLFLFLLALPSCDSASSDSTHRGLPDPRTRLRCRPRRCPRFPPLLSHQPLRPETLSALFHLRTTTRHHARHVCRPSFPLSCQGCPRTRASSFPGPRFSPSTARVDLDDTLLRVHLGPRSPSTARAELTCPPPYAGDARRCRRHRPPLNWHARTAQLDSLPHARQVRERLCSCLTGAKKALRLC